MVDRVVKSLNARDIAIELGGDSPGESVATSECRLMAVIQKGGGVRDWRR
jgi:hypothetical protein